ncbi:MAG: hypothetical protein HDQ44_03300 [Desulfovibrio sp.]|nr:hypothetical protein [Desulfovibrio sp.]
MIRGGHYNAPDPEVMDARLRAHGMCQ